MKSPRRYSSFRAYVESLPPDEQATIRRAEAEYLANRSSKLRSLEATFNETLLGAEDKPAGPRAKTFYGK